MPCSYPYLQENFYKRFDGAVSITVVLKKLKTKLKIAKLRVRAPVKPFLFIFLFLVSQSCSKVSCLHVCRKKHVLMNYALLKRLHSLKWRGLYGDTATMQELLLKTCASSAWRKRSLEWSCHWIVYWTGLHDSLDVSRSIARKIVEEKKKAKDEQQQPKQRRKCHWRTLTRVLYGGPSSACTHWRRFCQPLITSEQSCYADSKGRLCKYLLHMKFVYTRCGVNQKVPMER